ncbi:MAG: M20/M25/M40 family metallo-hydrolase [Ignavibacteriales bacterium]|nr:M20/M25/M40 family metallo-hydrolase [Ignavibacteriales bacterium]
MKLQKFLFLISVFLFLNVFNYAQIKKEELIKTVEFLASKELAGRLPGSDGYTKAANFIAGELAKLNFLPGGDDNYFQKLKVEYNEILAPEHFSVIKDGKTINYKIGDDYAYRGFTGAGNFTAPVVFCGYGLSQSELGYDDYSGIDVKGKVVLAFKYNPKWNIDGKNFINGNPREKAIVAANHGAIGILFVSFPNDAEPQRPIGSVIHGEGEQMINFPEIHIDLPAADEILSGSNHTLKDLQTLIDSTKKPYSIQLVPKVDIEVHTKYEKEKEVVNVVGMIEGSDPGLKKEYLIIGAHLDHVGSQAGKIYFPGANDNASGSAALLQIAREFSKAQEKPKRSIIFAFFASEEQGLYGSKYFSENMKFSKEKVKAMINLDCVGYGDSIQIGGGESAQALWNIAKQIDNGNDKLLVTRTWKGGGADAEPFYEKGIQTLYFVTTNSYKHLHMLSDKPETLNLPVRQAGQNLFEAITKLAFKTIVKIAE